jgi:hypothetical protein
LFVFQQAGLTTDFQTPFALQLLIATEQTRAMQALGLLPPWQFFSQLAFICEQELRESLQPSCAKAWPAMAPRATKPIRPAMTVFILDPPASLREG